MVCSAKPGDAARKSSELRADLAGRRADRILGYRDCGRHRLCGRCTGNYLSCDALVVVWVSLVSVAIGAVTGIFKMALYLFATTGEVPGDFQGTGLEEAFANRKELKAERKAKRAAKRAASRTTNLAQQTA